MRDILGYLFYSVVLAIYWVCPVFAQLEVERLFPCVVSTDSETKVKVEGKFAVWPVEVSCDRSKRLKTLRPAGIN